MPLPAVLEIPDQALCDDQVFLERTERGIAVHAEQSSDALAAATRTGAAGVVVVDGKPPVARVGLPADRADPSLFLQEGVVLGSGDVEVVLEFPVEANLLNSEIIFTRSVITRSAKTSRIYRFISARTDDRWRRILAVGLGTPLGSCAVQRVPDGGNRAVKSCRQACNRFSRFMKTRYIRILCRGESPVIRHPVNFSATGRLLQITGTNHEGRG